MKIYYIIVRGRINIGRAVSDQDLQVLDCYYTSPIFFADSSKENVEIAEEAYELFCGNQAKFRHIESVELIVVA